MGRRDEDPYELALRALSHKERTESELRAWLAEREVTEVEIEQAIALLIDAGAIDDASFARRYAEDKVQLAGWGPDRIASSLEKRGVPREHIEAALGGDDQEALLERAVSVLGDRGMSCEDGRERERALGLLVRRGYPLDLAYEAVRTVERPPRR
ncbi:MAG: RecX family transcriptional regulator [Solirubrobacterales bacterium]